MRSHDRVRIKLIFEEKRRSADDNFFFGKIYDARSHNSIKLERKNYIDKWRTENRKI